MKKIIVLLILGVCLVVGCTTTTTNKTAGTSCVTCSETEDGLIVFDVKCNEGDDVQFKDLVDSVRIVVFDESVEKALIGRFIENIHKGGGRIIVEDDSDYPVKFFDNNGKFINSLREGQGPGEVDFVEASCYNLTTKEFIVYNGGTISIFDNDGNFKSKVQVPFNISKMTCLNTDYLFYVMNWGFRPKNDSLNCAFIVTDKNFNIKYKALPFAPNSGVSESYSGPDNHFFRHLGDRVEFPNNDTIYSYDGKTLTPKIYVEYDNKLSSKPADMKHAKTMEYSSNGSTQIFIVGSHTDYETHKIVRDAKSGHFYALFDSYKERNLNGTLLFWTMMLEDRSTCMTLYKDLVSYIHGIPDFVIDKIPSEQQSLLNQVKTDEDAHWLVFFKFKDF
ncbi:MAG: 6-bladed beta-propeller [Bacteroidales bacterium]|nr:6-bladed beta-propeller [Bacteroidales bacterium]